MKSLVSSLMLLSILVHQIKGWMGQTELNLDRKIFPMPLLKYNKYSNLILRNPSGRSDVLSKHLETIYLVIYYESFCNDSRNFFATQLMAAYELLEPYLDVRLIPYGKSTTRIEDSTEYYTFTCHHGPLECYGNKLHACSLDVYPSERNANIFNICLMDFDHNSQGSDDTAVDRCGRSLGLDVKNVKQCAKNKTGNFLLNYYGQRTKMTKFKYVPHILVNGVYNNGTNLLVDICAVLKHPPSECKIFKN